MFDTGRGVSRARNATLTGVGLLVSKGRDGHVVQFDLCLGNEVVRSEVFVDVLSHVVFVCRLVIVPLVPSRLRLPSLPIDVVRLV